MWVAWWLLQSLATELSHDAWRLVMWSGRGYEEARTLATCGGWVLVGGGGAICGFCILLALGIF
eukprot:COSAG04_NODE_848_length_9881_cov_5.280822_3_plen_64_part_00